MPRVAVLGVTGSIGTQALEVLRKRPEFEVCAVAAGGGNLELLAAQVAEFEVPLVAVFDAAAASKFQDLLRQQGTTAQVVSGLAGVLTVARIGADVVLNGITGSIGLRPTLAALETDAVVALANKESLVAGMGLLREACATGRIVPVDSEHSAIAQALRSGTSAEVSKLILTASGGAFRGHTAAELAEVTVAEALAHPTWDMGPVVTINSATLMNKALEVLEAHVLFGVPMDQIEVVIHPQSMVHSMVQFRDGSVVAQVSYPDMRLPIALGLSWPDRWPGVVSEIDWSVPHQWDFSPVDNATFPAISLARQAVASSPLHPAVMNAANEVAVASFRDGNLSFVEIVDTVAQVVEAYDPAPAVTVDSIAAAEKWARSRTLEMIGKQA